MTKTTAQDRRTAALAAICNKVTETTTAQEFGQLAEEMEALATLGRTDRWKAACRFAAQEINQAMAAGTYTREHGRWAVLQGSVWMGYANI